MRSRRVAPRAVCRYRRARHLVVYWAGESLRISNYATRITASGTPQVCEILDFCGDWKTPRQISSAIDIDVGLATRLIERLASLSLLEQSNRPIDPRVAAMARLDPWNPEAGFFHMASRDVRFASPERSARHEREKAKHTPMPPVVKRYRGVPRIDLPSPQSGDSDFADTLLRRRTWRRYSSTPVRLDELSTLLAFTAGIQQWVRVGETELPLKTSPSGGARHGIECYVVIRDVKGLKAGIYHYAPDRHALERLRGPVRKARIRAYLPQSGYFANASAVVFFTVIFERITWRYPYSRAYRAALAEAGHLCQTFCLTATWLDLAPFCLMGLADSLVEQDLGIDGISEAVLYAAGVGRRPARTEWAPLTRGTLPVRVNRRVDRGPADQRR